MFDSHLHFDSFEEQGEAEALIERALEAGVGQMIAIGGSDKANLLAADMRSRYPGAVGCSFGYDRDEVEGVPDFADLKSMVKDQRPNAIGEAGLDYHYRPESAPEQRALFQGNLDIAAESGLPIVIHSREAEEDTLAMLSAHASAFTGPKERLGVLHCFTGDRLFAEKLVELGYYISFSGIVTFKNAAVIREAAAIVPEDRLLIETDAPYLAPVPHRGKTNEPAYVVHVAEVLAEIRGDTASRIGDITAQNAQKLFGMESS